MIMSDYSENTSKSDGELLKMYYNFYLSLGRPPTVKDLNSWIEISYNSNVLLSRFQTMSNLRRLAGVPQIKVNSARDKDEIKEDLMSIYKHFGKTSGKRLSELSKYKLSTICEYYKTTKIKEIWEEIETEYNNKS